MMTSKARKSPAIRWLAVILLALLLAGGFWGVRWVAEGASRSPRLLRLREWLRNPEAHADWSLSAGERCGTAPFSMPTDGYIGFVWGDSFRPGHRHQGLDIFGGREPGETPVVAAYSGYLTRLAEWKSSVIIRIPQDPLQQGRQIWTYYTHMADQQGNSFIAAQFPPGTADVYVEEGTLLGYQGDYSGDPGNPTGVHLHFSIVKDGGDGTFRNELDIENTIDPSPYLGMELEAGENPDGVPTCLSTGG